MVDKDQMEKKADLTWQTKDYIRTDQIDQFNSISLFSFLTFNYRHSVIRRKKKPQSRNRGFH